MWGYGMKNREKRIHKWKAGWGENPGGAYGMHQGMQMGSGYGDIYV